MFLFTVKDTESQTHIAPFVMKTKRDAIEGFRMVCNDEKTDYFKFPNDFMLMCIGKFDEKEGKVTPLEPVKIAIAKDLKLEGNDAE